MKYYSMKIYEYTYVASNMFSDKRKRDFHDNLYYINHKFIKLFFNDYSVYEIPWHDSMYEYTKGL